MRLTFSRLPLGSRLTDDEPIPERRADSLLRLLRTLRPEPGRGVGGRGESDDRLNAGEGESAGDGTRFAVDGDDEKTHARTVCGLSNRLGGGHLNGPMHGISCSISYG